MNNKKKLPELVLRKMHLLNYDVDNALVVALIMAKTQPNIFLGKNDTQYRGVINFTLRDSQTNIVNCKYWGSREKVEEYNQKFQIGEIIDVFYPRIMSILQNSEVKVNQSMYQPLPTLPITLVINEGVGTLEKHSYHDMDTYAELKKLWRVSHKPLYSVLNLADIKKTFDSSNCQTFYADFLVMVGLKRQKRDFKNKMPKNEGKPDGHCLDLIIFDQSQPQGILLTFWHPDWIDRAETYWQPMKTVLHLIDVKVGYSEFYKATVLTFTSRSLLYENPQGQETDMLMQFGQSIPICQFDAFRVHNATDNMPKPEQIETIMTVQQIYNRCDNYLGDNSESFSAVVYGMITQFDFDVPRLILNKKCKSCNRFLSNTKSECANEQCQLSFSFNFTGDKFEIFFNINVHVSDQTGTLLEAKLSDTIANRILAMTTAQYLELSTEELEQIKWSYLLNYFEVKLFIRKPNILKRNLELIIVDMRPIDLDTLSKNIAVY